MRFAHWQRSTLRRADRLALIFWCSKGKGRSQGARKGCERCLPRACLHRVDFGAAVEHLLNFQFGSDQGRGYLLRDFGPPRRSLADVTQFGIVQMSRARFARFSFQLFVDPAFGMGPERAAELCQTYSARRALPTIATALNQSVLKLAAIGNWQTKGLGKNVAEEAAALSMPIRYSDARMAISLRAKVERIVAARACLPAVVADKPEVVWSDLVLELPKPDVVDRLADNALAQPEAAVGPASERVGVAVPATSSSASSDSSSTSGAPVRSVRGEGPGSPESEAGSVQARSDLAPPPGPPRASPPRCGGQAGRARACLDPASPPAPAAGPSGHSSAGGGAACEAPLLPRFRSRGPKRCLRVASMQAAGHTLCGRTLYQPETGAGLRAAASTGAAWPPM